MDYGLYGLGIAYRGMVASQAALNTIANNLSNANTEGYSRQRIEAAPAPSTLVQSMGTGISLSQLGGGVDVRRIIRNRDEFLDVRMRAEISDEGYASTLKQQINFLETQFQEPGPNGLGSVINSYFSAWDQLSVNPESSAARSEVRQIGLSVANTFRSLYENINRMRIEADSEIQNGIVEVNSYIDQVVTLNKEIAATRTLGSEPNALMDRRDLLVEKMSRLVNVQTSVQEDGKMFVFLGGRALVDGDKAEHLEQIPSAENTLLDVSYRGEAIPGEGLGGRLRALLEMRDQVIGRSALATRLSADRVGEVQGGVAKKGLEDTPDGILYQLDTLANEFANRVNTLHVYGSPLDPNFNRPDPAKNGLPTAIPSNGLLSDDQLQTALSGDFKPNIFFQNAATKPGSTKLPSRPGFIGAGQIDVAADILAGNAGLNRIAAGKPRDLTTGADPGPGDNGTAKQIALLRSTPMFGTTTETLGDRYRTFLSDLGVKGQFTERMATNQENLIEHLKSQREQTSGVNFDQVMSDMVRYQHAYNASAKIINMLDQALDKLINGMPPGR